MRKYIGWVILPALAASAWIASRTASAAFASAFDEWIGDGYRRAASAFSSLFPFSLGCTALLLLPPLVFLLIRSAIRSGKNAVLRRRFLAALLSGISLLSLIQTVSCGFSFRAQPIAEKLGYSADERADSERLSALIRRVSAEVGSLDLSCGFPDPQAVFALANDKLSAAFSSLGLPAPRAVKPLPAPALFAKAGPIGLYLPIGCESQVNLLLPSSEIPFCAAHEMAHSIGAAREEDAAFLGFLACEASGDPRIRFSGLLAVADEALAALSSADAAAFASIYPELPAEILSAREEYAAFCDRYGGKAKIAADAAGDLLLRAQGTEGLISYGGVVSYALSYYSL